MSNIVKTIFVGIMVSVLSTSIPVTQPIVDDSQPRYEDIARYVELRQREKRVHDVFDSVRSNLTDVEKEDLARIIAEESLDNGFSVEFVMAVMKTESSFNKHATSPVGALGLMQLMPATGRAVAADYGILLKNEAALYNPQLNVTLGIRYLKRLADRFNDMNLVLAAYNMGPTRLRKSRPEGAYPVFKYTRLVRKAHQTIEEL